MSGGGLHQNAGFTDPDASERMDDPQCEQVMFLAHLSGDRLELRDRHHLVGFVVERLQGAMLRVGLRSGRAPEEAVCAPSVLGPLWRERDRAMVEFDLNQCSHRDPAYTFHVLEPAVPISVFDLPPRGALASASRLGFRSVTLSAAQPGLRPRELDRSARRGLAAELRRLELHCSGIDLFLPREHYQQSDHLDRALAAALGAIELADDLGADSVFLRLPPADAEAATDEVIRELAVHAARARTRVCDISLDGEALAAIRSGVELPIDAAMDTGSWLAAGHDPLAGVVELTNRLGGIRIVDLDGNGTRGSTATGSRLDLDALRTALELGGFRGAVVLDARGWQDPVNGLLHDLEAWRLLRSEGG